MLELLVPEYLRETFKWENSLGSRYQRVQPMATWFHVSRPGMKQCVREAERWDQKAEVRWGFGKRYSP